ncbi:MULTISPECIES: SDR family NAD(P)-dependent oxidoreductase [Kocuria]|uniref:SDR family NAD(P)-dependent oxidoreductase n=1 Tax=Kocuria TaxID=57493 RepID=UPI0021A5815E|nr:MULTISPECIES: SDR family NAD(P)-dependent oxidoreductase [Kocuria]MCT1545570.1 SDR family NAD(P)-dependent oxidoreductase [Kocuria rhizophila]MCT2171514.1 SDR family NAD(P)-dependent oxidoreductase [Kocuria rhizophila]MDN3461941.1 SDR family NAD(P)-dependent oxidoreductase [Kocuria sp. APC 4018]
MTQHVLITGASSGFGAALVRAYAQQGWKITATMRNLAKKPSEFDSLDGVSVVSLDVTDEASIAAAVAEAEATNGPVDVLLNVAGYVVQGAVEEVPLAEWRAQFETNVVGVVAVTQAVLPGMRERHRGHVINFSSGAGVIGMPRLAAYSASKFAVEGLTESLAREVKHLGIRVTMVEPGVFETELGSSASQTENPIDAYDATAEQMPDLYDWTPGDLDASARAIVTISEDDAAPVRFYVGHGLDSVRRHYDERLAQWARYEDLTNTTKTKG